ncbi:hypothetical protein OH77DRAFT_873857 [Trametes cingulata]|nr:hypothetical protein OH77DRAFT_873857 [Trametes cingulata]
MRLTTCRADVLRAMKPSQRRARPMRHPVPCLAILAVDARGAMAAASRPPVGHTEAWLVGPKGHRFYTRTCVSAITPPRGLLIFVHASQRPYFPTRGYARQVRATRLRSIRIRYARLWPDSLG